MKPMKQLLLLPPNNILWQILKKFYVYSFVSLDMNKAFRSIPVVEYTTENEIKIQVLPQEASYYC